MLNFSTIFGGNSTYNNLNVITFCVIVNHDKYYYNL